MAYYNTIHHMKYMRPLSLFNDLQKMKAVEQGRLLGLDVGDKYVGLAVSDPGNKIASPLSVLIRKKTNIDLMATDFQRLISELSLAGFIVGYPSDRRRSGADAVQVKLFVDDLCKTGKLEGLRYTYWNESFTSKNVEFLIKPLNLHPVHSKTIFDKLAAVGILQIIQSGILTWLQAIRFPFSMENITLTDVLHRRHNTQDLSCHTKLNTMKRKWRDGRIKAIVYIRFGITWESFGTYEDEQFADSHMVLTSLTGKPSFNIGENGIRDIWK
ncbi:putative pre-16S rRNA nuclease [Dillenia turbinata]|uniref:Pre-16S rRNA nuclease n=1 Tax=Dillenia turbinata TaxID=194707 RepID=A0AAN8ZWL2_9MAGN